jgi:ABC-type Fe3+ transport system substrate-binding protein
MELLIKTSDGSEVNRWSVPPGKVPIPGSGDVVFPGDSPRPIDIGPDHFLATATVVDEDIGDGQKRGPETVGVVGQAVTVTRTTVAKTEEDILNDWKGAMSDTDRDVPRSTEDIYDALDEDAQGRVVQIVRDRITAKKTLRGQKP